MRSAITKMKTRLEYINWIRAIATISVVVLHVASNNWYGYVGSANWNVFTCYLAATRFSVPIFVMISGVLFLRKEYSISVKRLYLHNIGRMLVFLVFWHVVYQVYNTLVAGESLGVQSFVNIVKNLLNGQTQVHLWFVYMIIGIYMICPIFKIFVTHASKQMIEYFLLLFFVMGCLPNFLGSFGYESLNMIATNLNKLSISTASGYIGYFILGYYLETYPLQKRKRIMVYALGIASLVLTIFLTYHKSVSAGTYIETYLGYTMPNVFIMSVAVFVWFKSLDYKDGIVQRIIKLISDNSLGIYGIHMLIVFLFWRCGLDTFVLPGIISVPLISLAIVVISLLLICFIKKIPLIGKYIA